MRFATIVHGGVARVGRIDEGELVLLAPVDEVGVAALIGCEAHETGERVPLGRTRLLAPIPRPRRNVFCVGKNYHDHAQEFAASGYDSSAAKGTVPEHPIVFSKVPESVAGPGAPVLIDRAVTQAVDYEVELAVSSARLAAASRATARWSMSGATRSSTT